MAWDDPIVWVLIIGVTMFLFGANKIPQIARGLGQARREFDMASKGITESPSATQGTLTSDAQSASKDKSRNDNSIDPILIAARNEGIVTTGKTREQIASELAWKLNKK